MRRLSGEASGNGKRFTIIASRWHEAILKQLVEGAIDEFGRSGAPEVEIIHVPGAWEIPVAAAKLAARPKGERPHGIVALGCIMQGATAHAGLLGAEVSSALMRIQIESGVPIAWGILTPESHDQALQRSGLKLGNKGREAAIAVLEMAILLEKLAE